MFLGNMLIATNGHDNRHDNSSSPNGPHIWLSTTPYHNANRILSSPWVICPLLPLTLRVSELCHRQPFVLYNVKLQVGLFAGKKNVSREHPELTILCPPPPGFLIPLQTLNLSSVAYLKQLLLRVTQLWACSLIRSVEWIHEGEERETRVGKGTLKPLRRLLGC
jgi:hypothetical protein